MGSVGCMSFDYLTDVTDDHFPQASKCGKCHIAIYDEWSGSDHAHAFTNPHFQSATHDYTFKDCLNCHAPEPRVSASLPKIRRAHQEDGVTCVSCHFNQGVLTGPLPTTGKVQPHPVGVDPALYQSSELCGRCHEGTFQQWQNADMDDKPTCQVCHMPVVTRKVTQPAGGFSNIIVSFEEEVPQRQHVFAIQTERSIHEMVSVQATRTGSRVELSIRNNLPHLLPTGDFGFRVLDLTVTRTEAQGDPVILLQEELTRELKTALGPGETWRRVLPVPEPTSILRLQLQRRSYPDQPVLVLCDQEVDLK